MSNQISQEDHDLALQELQDKYTAKLASIEHMREAEIVKRVAPALALSTTRASSPLHGKSLFRPIYTSPIKNPLPKSSSAAGPSLVVPGLLLPKPTWTRH